MMYSYPFYSFPRFKRYPPYYGSSLTRLREPFIPPIPREEFSKNLRSSQKGHKQNLNSISHEENIYRTKGNTKNGIPHNTKNNSCHDTIENTKNENDEDVLFEIFGLKLFYDDVLLICLIFFLYQEGVEDQYLFVALVLLLLS